MMNTRLFAIVGCFLVVAILLAAPSRSSGEGVGTGEPAAAVKTYKRRCTNYKCKKVSEGTQPIFKCPFCGASTVPQG